ncbi:ABC-2 type transport system permease protein [Mesonia hippocampi]|uniref:ABC-2 type transport system permease protein n=1 Tax=Mesonia hippocampi TaxID=1628250 RepID=A0A840EZN3_9FLAO|nr:ABC transporter permease [Mesonia hippocampi]MBB4119484.1 ABC-2 type transport system permease protein [Mesonia hippocampi]
MRSLKLIIHREFLAKVKNRTFIIMTFVSPLIMVGMFFLVAYLANLNNSETRNLAILDESNLMIHDFVSSEKTKYHDFSTYSLTQALDSVKAKAYYGLLYIPKEDNIKALASKIELFANKTPNGAFVANIEQQISHKLTNKLLTQQGVNLSKIDEAQTQVSLKIENFSGEETSKMSMIIKMIFGGVAGYLLMMFIIIYGNMVMRSVIEEKTNRIIEIIISSVKPRTLMLGKVLGTSLAGISQFLIWVIIGSVLLGVVSTFLGGQLSSEVATANIPNALDQASMLKAQLVLQEILALPLGQLIVCFLIYFIGGYFLYSAIYAAIGAAVDNETDTQQFMFPVIMPLMLAVYVGFFSVIDNPHGIVAIVFSHIPLTSPIVMLMRIPYGVAWWEILISIAILIGSIFFFVWIAAKIYRVGILMYGKKPSYKELIKWLKY